MGECGVPGGRGKKDFAVGNIYIPPESKSRVIDIQRKLGDIVADVHEYERQGRKIMVGIFMQGEESTSTG